MSTAAIEVRQQATKGAACPLLGLLFYHKVRNFGAVRTGKNYWRSGIFTLSRLEHYQSSSRHLVGAGNPARLHVSNLTSAVIAVSNMEGLFFNVNGGYVEGIVRGYRNTLLTGQNYNNLTQCETIDGKLNEEEECNGLADGSQMSSSSLDLPMVMLSKLYLPIPQRHH